MSKYDDAVQVYVDRLGEPVLLLHLNEVSKLHLSALHDVFDSKHYKKLTILLQTPGGDADAAFILSKVIKKHVDQIDVVVPFFAKSAGTLMALTADRIILDELSELGPLDAQVGSVEKGTPKMSSALNGYRALEQVQNHCALTLDTMTQLLLSRSQLSVTEAIQAATDFVAKTSARLYERIDPMIVGELSSSLQIGERYAVRILTQLRGLNLNIAAGIANRLVNTYPSHGYVLDAYELQDMGLTAEEVDDTDETIFDLRAQMIKELRNSDPTYAIIKIYQPTGER